MKTKLTILILITSVLYVEAQTWSWSEDSLSYARMGLSATAMDESIFYSGGRIDETTNFSNVIDIFDVGEDEWETIELLTSERWLTSAVSTNEMVFFAGGNNFMKPGFTSFDEIDVYSKVSGEWTVENLSSTRYFMGTVACGNKVFFAGGGDFGTSNNVVDIYDTETGTWSVKYLDVARWGIGAVAAGNKVFFAGGGIGANQVTNVVDIYDTNTGEWTVDSLSEARVLTAAVAYGDRVYFAGGAIPNSTTSSAIIDIYNVVDESWEDIEILPEPRIVTALNVKDALVFTGVCDYIDLSNFIWTIDNGTVEIYYPETGVWDLTVPPLNPARIFYAYASYDNKAYYAGGWIYSPSQQGPVNTVNILEYTPADTTGISDVKISELAIRLYPNPFISTLCFDYHLQSPGNVNITIYNNIGEQVIEVVNEYQQQGSQLLLYNAENLRPGVYFCVLKTYHGIHMTKMIKL